MTPYTIKEIINPCDSCNVRDICKFVAEAEDAYKKVNDFIAKEGSVFQDPENPLTIGFECLKKRRMIFYGK